MCAFCKANDESGRRTSVRLKFMKMLIEQKPFIGVPQRACRFNQHFLKNVVIFMRILNGVVGK